MAFPVSLALALPVPLHGFRVGLPVLAGIIGISSAPFLLAVQADLVVLGVRLELMAVIFPAALPLAIGSAANKLMGMTTGKLKQLLAVATAAMAHQATPNGDEIRLLWPESDTPSGRTALLDRTAQ